MIKTYNYCPIFLLSLFFVISCKENSLLPEKNLPIETIDEFAGSWKGKSECKADGRKLDSLTVDMSFDGELMTINFSFHDSKNEGLAFPTQFRLEYKNYSESLMKHDTIILQPTSVQASNGTNGAGSELYPENTGDFPEIRLVKKSQTVFKMLYDLPKSMTLIYQQSNKNIGYAKFESGTEFEISKIGDDKDFWYFNKFKSMADFSNPELAFIIRDLDADEYVLANKANLSIYFDLPNDNGVSDKNDFLKDFSKYGSVFKLDANADGQQDLAGYFVRNRKLYFMVFLSNGISYNKFFSQELSLEDEQRPVLVKDTLNGKEVFRINYVKHYLTNYLYYDSLEKRMKIHYTD